jgi:cytochrome c5
VSQQDTIAARNLSLGIVTGLGVIAAVIIVIILLMDGLLLQNAQDEPADMRNERMKPIGQINIKEEVASVAETTAPSKAPVTDKSGKEVYDTVCMACHTPGVLEAPKFGDKAGWAARIAKGEETLFSNAINGLNVMPPRGGKAELSDEEVKRAVQYMLAAVADDSAPEVPPVSEPQEAVTAPADAPEKVEAAPKEATPEITPAPEKVVPEAAPADEQEKAEVAPEKEAASTLPASEEAKAVKRDFHLVQQSETLYSISKRYNVSTSEITAWNNLQDNSLSVGQKLWVSPPNSIVPPQLF